MSNDIKRWIALGREATACEGFEYFIGMHCAYRGSPCIILSVGRAGDGEQCVSLSGPGIYSALVPASSPDLWPDLRDPGTVGHVEAQMRDVYMADAETVTVGTRWRGEGLEWFVDGSALVDPLTAPTRAEAIIAAWKAAS